MLCIAGWYLTMVCIVGWYLVNSQKRSIPASVKTGKIEKKLSTVKEREKLANYINETWQRVKILFSQEYYNLQFIIEDSYSVLYRNTAYIERYRNKYPNLVEELYKINDFVIRKKANLIVEEFFEEKGSHIVERYKFLNFELISEFEDGLEEYLERVKETNGEIFVGELFNLATMVKVVKNPKRYVERIFEERFLSREMLEDAIFQYLQQLDTRLEENMNRFLVDIEAAFLEYLKEIGEMEFLFEPKEIYNPIEEESITSIYEEVLFQLPEELCPAGIKEEIGSKIKKDLMVQGGSTILGIIPGVNFLMGLGADAASMYYEKKLKEEVEIALNQIVREIRTYVMEANGLDLRGKITEFIDNYERRKQELLKRALLEQLVLLHKDIFVRNEVWKK
jgi:hypothetical protein